MGQRLVVGAIAIVVASCQPLASPVPSMTDRTPPPTITPPSPSLSRVPVEHRIGVRIGDRGGEFFDRETGQRFVPRGANLVRLAAGRHSTLDVGRYDQDRLDATLAAMAADGFNVVRVFLNSFPGGLPGDNHGLSGPYLDNVADLLLRSRRHGLQVVLTQDWLPESPDWSFSPDPLIENVNSMYLSTGGVEANERFFTAFASGLVERGAALDSLLAYELRNELYLTESAPPFSLSSGVVRAANGQHYDLATPDERRALLEENVVYWVDRMRSVIREVDPTALVTVGFFQPKGPNASRAGDDRIIETRETIARSTADFIDLHGYPGGELDLRRIVENYDLPPVTDKPILLGEFGAEHGPYPIVNDAVRALVEWQVESCSYGFDGWLAWTWDTAEQPEFWTAVDEDAAIARALAPATRPDPCLVGNLGIPVELTRDASTTASRSLGDSPSANAIDGSPETIWNAGDDAPHWIEIDLGAERNVEAIRLLVAQFPAGATTHVVSVRGGTGAARPIDTLSGSTVDGDWLQVTLPVPLQRVRHIRIETRASPSWPAWREISVLGQAAD